MQGSVSFFGRDRELTQLQRFMSQGGEPVILTGERGVGKSRLAQEFLRNIDAAQIRNAHYIVVDRTEHGLRRLGDLLGMAEQGKELTLVIDDFDRLAPVNQLEILTRLRDLSASRPNFRVLVVAFGPSFGESVFARVIRLEPLPQWHVETLLNHLVTEGRKALRRESIEIDSAAISRMIGGNPAMVELTSRYLLSSGSVDEALELLVNGFERIEIVGHELEESELSAVAQLSELQPEIVQVASTGLLMEIMDAPEILYELSSRKFEETIADILSSLEFEIVLTGASRDGGVDIYARKSDVLGPLLYVVECKKYAPTEPVGVGIVRALSGVVFASKANAGIVATTSYFTKGAKSWQKDMGTLISLKDYESVLGLIEASLRKQVPAD